MTIKASAFEFSNERNIRITVSIDEDEDIVFSMDDGLSETGGYLSAADAHELADLLIQMAKRLAHSQTQNTEGPHFGGPLSNFEKFPV